MHTSLAPVATVLVLLAACLILAHISPSRGRSFLSSSATPPSKQLASWQALGAERLLQEVLAATLNQLTFDGTRCVGAPEGGWGALAPRGNVSMEQCKQACLNKISCKFVVYRMEDGMCSEYKECATFRSQPSFSFTTWAKNAEAPTNAPTVPAGCTVGTYYNNTNEMQTCTCNSSVLSAGTRFCLNGQTLTVAKSWNSMGQCSNGSLGFGATVKLISPASSAWNAGDTIVVGEECPTAAPTPTPTLPVCTDIASPWMVSKTLGCSTWAWGVQKCGKCNNDEVYALNKYCQYSCSLAGCGYGDACEPPATTTGVCSDKPSPWMVSKGLGCSTWAWGVQKCAKCNNDESFVSNKYCQHSCFVAGCGYQGDVCTEP